MSAGYGEATPEVYMQILKQRAVDAFNAGKYSDSLDYFTKAIELTPENAQLYWCRGVTLSRLELYQRAIEDFDRSIELDPQNEGKYDHNPAFTDREKAYSSLRKLKGAEKSFGLILIRRRKEGWVLRWRIAYGNNRSWQWAPAKDLETVRTRIVQEAEKLDEIIREALQLIDGTSERYELNGEKVCRRKRLGDAELGCLTLALRRMDNLEKAVKLIKSKKWQIMTWKVPDCCEEIQPFFVSGEKAKSQYLLPVACDDTIVPSEVIV